MEKCLEKLVFSMDINQDWQYLKQITSLVYSRIQSQILHALLRSYVRDNSILGDDDLPNAGKLLNPVVKSSYKTLADCFLPPFLSPH